LDIASEIGLPAVMAFAVLIYLILKKSRRNLAFFVFIGLLADFQLYYSFKIYAVIVIFYMIIGILFEDGKNRPLVFSRNWLLAFSAIPLVVIQFGFLSKYFIDQGNYKAAVFFDPFNKRAYERVIGESIGDYRSVVHYRALYERVYHVDTDALRYLAAVDLFFNEEEKALEKSMRSMTWNPFEGDFKKRISDTFYLVERVRGKKEAINYLNNLTKRINGMWEYGHTNFKESINEMNMKLNPSKINIIYTAE
jgi:hypothetical protein